MHDTQSCLRKLLSNELLLSLTKYRSANSDHSPNPHRKDAHLKTPEPLLQLTKPSCIMQQLESIGIPPSIATKISSGYLEAASQLYAVCQSSFHDTVISSHQRHLTQNDVEAITQVWHKFYTQRTSSWLDSVLSLARQAIAKQGANTEPLNTDVKPVFNYDYRPVLDKYFEYNAYPSTSDKTILARKSNMTFRQIEVWFQNHRSRSRKEGRLLRKPADNIPPEVFSTIMENIAPCPANSEVNDITQLTPPYYKTLNKNFPVSQSTGFTPSPSSNMLNFQRPSHVFPAIYPPPRGPFPASTGTHKFPAPVWRRTPAAAHTTKNIISIDELVKEFDEKLHLRTPILSRQRSKIVSKPWWATKVTIPSPAPLPALIQLHVTSSSIYTQPLPVLPAVPVPHPLLVSISTSSPQSATPTLQREPNVSVCKKIPRLPRRTPKNASIAHRGSQTSVSTSPALSRTSSSSSSSLSSSDAEQSTSYSRLASDRSSSSLASSRPTTPTLQKNLHPPPVVALPRFELEHGDSFSQYDLTSELDSETVFAFPPDLPKYHQAPVTFESLNGLLMSTY